MKAALRLASLLFCLQTSFAADTPAQTPVVKLAQEIRIPKVEFRDATVQEAIAFLNQKSRSLDPKQLGVNVAIAGQTESKGSITLSLAEASLYDILQVVAGQAGLELQASETVIMLMPPKAK